MEQATTFPRMSSPSRSSNSAEADETSTADFLSSMLPRVASSVDRSNSQYSASNRATNHPPGFPSANKLVHPSDPIFGNLDTLRLSSNVTEDDLSSKGSNISAFTPLIAAPLASSTGSTVGTPSSSASSPETVASNASSNNGLTPAIQKETVRMFETDPPISAAMINTSSLGPSHFSYNDFAGLTGHNGGLGQLPLVNVLTSSSTSSSVAAEQQKLDQAKKRRDNRNRARLKDRNVLAEHKAEEIEGYEGEKPINDLLESLGEATLEEKKQKTKRAPKEKRDRKRKEKQSLPQGEEQEQQVADEDDEIQEEKEKIANKKMGGKQLTHSRSSNIDELNQNVFLVQTGSDDERTLLHMNDSLTASSDGLNFVPVTGKKKGKKMKEDNEKSKDYTRKSKEDTGRPPPGGGRDGNVAPIPPGRDVRPPSGGKSGDSRRSSNYHLRSRDVPVSGEGDKKTQEGSGLSSASSRTNSTTQPPSINEFPALNISQDFPALPTAEQTDKPQHIHSAWVRKPSTGSSSGSQAVPTNNNNNKAVITSNSPPPPGVSNSTTPPPQTDQCDISPSYTDPTNMTADQDADNVVAVKDDGGHVIKSVAAKQNSGDGAHSKSDFKNKPKIKTVKKNASLHSGHFDNTSSSKNNDMINCDKSIVSEIVHATSDAPTNFNNDPQTNEENKDIIVDDNNTSPSILTSANPLLCDDLIYSAELIDTSNADINFTANTEIEQVVSEMNIDCVSTSEQGSGQTTEEEQINTIANFEFDTRSNFGVDEVTLNEIDQDASEISFGFEVNFQLLDSSSAPKDFEKSKTEDDKSNGDTNEELVFGGTERDSIASVDNAILSFRAAHQGMVISDGYEPGFIPQPFASNYIPNFSQMNEGGEQAKEVEAVSPESGICSPLSWQGEESITSNITSPPLQPGSYPRRQEEGGDIMSQLNNSLKLHLRRSSRSPSPHNSVRSGSAGSNSANQSNTHNNFRQNLDDSGVHTTSRNMNQSSSRHQPANTSTRTMEQTVNTNNPNYGEIVSFLKVKWNESAKDKQAKVYGGGRSEKRMK